MTGHFRANVYLLIATLVLCSGIYPGILWLIGRTAPFREQAEGSLIKNPQGEVIGSRLIAQPFTGKEYFQPRPSAASYKGDASGGSNLGASNYLLRERVARQLGPIIRYGDKAEQFGKKAGDPVQKDIDAWFQSQPGVVARWAKEHPAAAQGWVKADKLNTDFVARWLNNWKRTAPEKYAAWLKDNPNTPQPKAEDVAVPFFEAFSETFPGAFPSAVEKRTPDGRAEKVIEPVHGGEDVQGYFFDTWRQEHAKIPLEPVPADMVMASGSGLDPHITLANARYQLSHWVARAQADKILGAKVESVVKARATQKRPVEDDEVEQIREQVGKEFEAKLGKPLHDKIGEEIEALLEKHKEAPLGGLVGPEIVNVLELNLAVMGRMEELFPPPKE